MVVGTVNGNCSITLLVVDVVLALLVQLQYSDLVGGFLNKP